MPSAEALRQEITKLRQRLEQKQAEEQLRGSEGRLRAVLDAALDAVIGMDASDVITYWNPRAEAIFGWSPEEALGKVLRELIIPERYREAHSRGLARFLATGEGPVLDRRKPYPQDRRPGANRFRSIKPGEVRRTGPTNGMSALRRVAGWAPACDCAAGDAERCPWVTPPGEVPAVNA